MEDDDFEDESYSDTGSENYSADPNYNIPLDLRNIVELELHSCENLILNKELPSLKKLRVEGCYDITIKNLAQLDTLNILYCEKITINVSSPILQLINMQQTNNVVIEGGVKSIKKIFISTCKGITIPFILFDETNVHIEDCENLICGDMDTTKSPFDFLSISLEDFQKLCQSIVIYPSQTDLKTQIIENEKYFKPHKFVPFSDRFVINGNTISRNEMYEEDSVDLLTSSRFYSFNEENKMVQIQTTNGLIELPDLIHYIEITTKSVCRISFGIIDSAEYAMEDDVC
ncbi:hypothetical protein QTN25_001074 [Entamoeba marina]